MRYGHFDDERREYVITTPHTPQPWINYLGSEEFFSLLSHRAGGYAFDRDARLRRLTRYRYNNIPTDMGGRYFYVHDDGDVWTPSHLPVKAGLDHFECRHGLGYSIITGARGGVTAQATFLVPPGEHAEVQRVTLTNTTSASKRIGLFSFVEFCLWDAWDDQTNYQRNLSIGEVEVEGSAIYHVTEYRERRDHFAVYGVNAPLAGFDTDRDTFVGPESTLGEAAVPRAGRSGDSVASGWYPVGSHHLDVSLEPGETASYVFVLGYVENPRDDKWEAPGRVNKRRARALLDRFATDAQVDAALAELAASWDELLGTFTVASSDERLDRMVNVWNPYQCMVTFNLSRSASYFETGIGRGMGFRDSNQDLLGFVHLVPERARQRILDIAATQLPDGSAYHQYQPLTKRGNDAVGSGFNDDPLWLILAVAAYLKETGDFALLDEPVPFDHDESLAAPLYEHLRRSFHHPIDNRGPHGLPLIGRADWNDCLNLNTFSEDPGESFQTAETQAGGVAESVFIAALLCYVGPEFVALSRRLGHDDEAAEAEKHLAEMRRAVDEHGWDGAWFRRAYDHFSRPVGSAESDEGQLWIEPQGMGVMAGLGVGDARAEQALASTRERLGTPHGLVLLDPAYTGYRVELGEVTSYPPGYKENGGIFCHNNPWVVIAETVLGQGEHAFDHYRRTAPAYREEISDVHGLEPYVYAQMIAGKEAPRHGEAKNSWLTGTAAWSFVAVSQHLLGIRPGYDGLVIDPCLGPDLPGFTVTRRLRGATYRVEVVNGGGRGGALTVDGEPVTGNEVPYAPPGATVEVRCEVPAP